MFSFLNNLADSLKRSLWFIPLFMTLCGLLLSMGLYQLDWIFWQRGTPLLGQSWGIDSDGVRYLFSNIGAAIITAMTTILSITLLIFTVLAGQFGAHVLRVFKIRTFSKFVIGWFSATYIYIIYYIYKITTDSQSGYVPQISITLGIVLTLSTLFLLIFYIHFLVRQIQAGTVISEIAEELWDLIKALEPYKEKKQEGKEVFLPEELGILDKEVTLNKPGYIQSIDKSRLREIAEENDLVIRVLHRVGSFILTGTTVVILYSRKELDEELASKVQSGFILGEKRIPVEDLECNLEHIVEMTLRALSPGINDLIVANNCIDYITESIALLVKKGFPDSHIYTDDGKLLLISKEFSFEGYINAALNPIREYAAKHSFVSIRLLDNLIGIIRLTDADERRRLIAIHFNAIFQASLQHHERGIDLASLNERNETFQSILKTGTE